MIIVSHFFGKEERLTLSRAHTMVSWRLNLSGHDEFGHREVDDAKNQLSGCLVAVCVGCI